MAAQYESTFAVQNKAAKMIANGDREGAIDMLTKYSNDQATMWFNLYGQLSENLLARYVVGRVNMKMTPALHEEWWDEVVKVVTDVAK